MTNKELEMEFKDFKDEVSKILESMRLMIRDITEKVPHKKELNIWKPQEGEEYYYSESDGSILSAVYNEDLKKHSHRIICGTAHETMLDAERYALINKYSNLYRKYVEEHSEELCWGNPSQDKFYAYYDFETNQIDISEDFVTKSQGTIYAHSKEVIYDAIEFIGKKNMLKYVFEVPVCE